MEGRLGEINYHHLFYFWNVVREGSISSAGEKLGVAQPTISEQIGSLERSLGVKVFERRGRRRVLSEMGQVVYRYADEIFLLGRELRGAIEGKGVRRARLVVGVTEGTPKLISYRLLEPALRMTDAPEIVCYEDPLDALVVQLANRAVDLVLSDAIVDAAAQSGIYSHLLGDSPLALFARRNVAVRLRPWFPGSLDGAPMLLPTPNTSLRRSLDRWFQEVGVRPRIVGEFQDSGLLARFGEQGVGIFPACSAVAEDMRTHHRVEVVGRIEGIRQSFYAVSAERKLVHPAVVLLTKAARAELFRD